MSRIRLLAIIEATSVTGPAKNLLQFGQIARSRPDGVELSIAVFRRPNDPDGFARAAAGASLSLHPIPEKGRFDRTVLDGLRALTLELKPDLIQTHAVKSHFLARRAGLHRLAPWLAFHHGYTWPTLSARLQNQLDRWSLPAASRVLTVSQPFREDLIRRGVDPSRISVIHNAIRADWGSAAAGPEPPEVLRRKLGIPPGRKVILIVGRLSREKDHRTLLEALRRLRGSHDCHLLIVGDGPERARIEAAAAALDLATAVTLTGQVPSAEPYYPLADIAVLSSLSEGSPNALLEAMAAGAPVVATRVGGVPEIVEDRDSALLTPPADAGGMTAALDTLLSDPALARRLAARSRELISTRHTPEARVDGLIRIYRDTLGLR